MSTLRYTDHVITDDDVAAVCDALRRKNVTQGELVEEFEDAIATYVEGREGRDVYAVACSNGTTALQIALMTTDGGPYVVVPAITFAATIGAVFAVGGIPILCDVDPDTGLMTQETLARVRTPYDAVIPVHMNGQIARIASDGRIVIEDAAHALGSMDEQGRPGNRITSTAATFSFHPAKTITTAEGGAVVFRDPEYARRARQIRSHGVDPSGDVARFGLNFRLSDVNSALGLSQMQRIENVLMHRAIIANAYDERLRGLEPRLKLLGRVGCVSSWHLYPVLIDFRDGERQDVMRRLFIRGIQTQVHYRPIYRHTFYKELSPSLPGAEEYWRRCLSLPIHCRMNVDDVDRVVDELRGALSL